MALNFEWDQAKATGNLRKHSVSFEEAATVFGDPLSITISDPARSVGEERFITIGVSEAGRVVVVSHADRSDTLRIISARKASRRERRCYEQG